MKPSQSPGRAGGTDFTIHMIYMHFGINRCVFMEIKSDSQGIEDIIKEYGGIEKRLNAVKEDFVNIIIDVDNYWEGRSLYSIDFSSIMHIVLRIYLIIINK